jgi:hypothetical protein
MTDNSASAEISASEKLLVWALCSGQEKLYNLLSGKWTLKDFVLDAENEIRVKRQKAQTELDLVNGGVIHITEEMKKTYLPQATLAIKLLTITLEKISEVKKLYNIKGPLEE